MNIAVLDVTITDNDLNSRNDIVHDYAQFHVLLFKFDSSSNSSKFSFINKKQIDAYTVDASASDANLKFGLYTRALV